MPFRPMTSRRPTMSEVRTEGGEGLLRRWSRRKQAARAAPPVEQALVPPQPPVAPPEPPLVLPDLDALGAGSDYTAFLQQGVPAELQRLALQRAWTSDAGISDFRGMAEYAWDFNAPRYGALWATDDIARLVQAVLAPSAPELGQMTPVLAELPALSTIPVPSTVEALAGPTETGAEAVADSPEPEPAPPLPRRHGSALPC